jgi:hypothetical protein
LNSGGFRFRSLFHIDDQHRFSPPSSRHYQLFRLAAYRKSFDQLLEMLPEKSDSSMMVDLLALAHDRGCEAELAAVLDADLAANQLPEMAALRERFVLDAPASPAVVVHHVIWTLGIV